jgi:ankyrin repeat protein
MNDDRHSVAFQHTPEFSMKTWPIAAIVRLWSVVIMVVVLVSWVAIGQADTRAEQLGNAVLRGDLAEINLLLSQGTDINAETFGNTALTTAVLIGAADVVKLLLEKGADVNTKDLKGRTPIQRAFDSVGKSPVMQLLTSREALCGPGRIGTASHNEALDGRRMAIVRLLLDHGADPNTIVADCTLLMWAALHGQIDLVRLLLRKGADVNKKIGDGPPALLWAAIGGHSEVIDLLKRHGAVTTLQQAAMIGDKKGVQNFLKAGADLHEKSECGWTPLVTAAWSGNRATTSLILKHGADVDSRTTQGATALMVACRRRNVEVARLLLNNGADLNATDEYGRTALIDAAFEGTPQIAKLLIDRGADIRKKDVFGKTAFMRAVEMGRVHVAKLLLNKGAVPKAAESDGWTAVSTAMNRRDPDMMRLLCQYGAKVTLPIAAMIGDMREAKGLIASGVDVNAIDAFGQTALSWAAAAGNTNVVKLLLDNGATVNFRDQDGWTPLIWAARNAHVEALRLLLDKGGDTNAVTQNGWTALMWAASNSQPEMVKLVADRGTHVNHSNWAGVTARDIAHKNPEIVAILDSHGARKNRSGTIRGNQCGQEWDYEPLGILTGAPAPRLNLQSIRMDSQEVTMRLRRSTFVVDAVFHFTNSGDTTTEWIGFPKRGNACRNGYLLEPAFVRFDTWVDGQKTQFSEEGRSGFKSEAFGSEVWTLRGQFNAVPLNNYNRWIEKQVRFRGWARTTIRLSYEADYVAFGPPPLVRCADYIVAAASRWEGAMRNFAFTVTTSEVGGTKNLARIDSNGLSLITEDFVQYDAMNYQPEAQSEFGAAIR